jgi:hypothetical protein
MALVVPYTGSLPLLDSLLFQLGAWYHLYVVDVVPDQDTTLADLVEASYPGYAAVQVTTWTPSVLVEGSAAAYADPILWTRSSSGSPQVVYGYYVTAGLGGPLLWAELRELGPITVQSAGDAVYLTPALTLASLVA